MEKYKSFYEKLSIKRGEDKNLNNMDIYRLNLFVKIIKKHFKDKKVKILDIGTRNAWLKQILDESNSRGENLKYRYYALEISEYYVNLMRKKNIVAYVGDITKKTSFKDNYFDVIVLGEILEHIPNLGLALAECKRILNKRGIIIGSTPNVWYIGNLINVLLRKDLGSSGEHIYWFDIYMLRNLFKFYDFKIIKIWKDAFLYKLAKFPKLNHLLSFLTNTGTNVFFILKK